MKKEVRFLKAWKTAEKISILNDRSNAYSEFDEDAFLDSMKCFGITNPNLWKFVYWNRQQCYASIYNKLLLAYLISEIKSGTILNEECLDSIKNRSVDKWEDFEYSDVGYKIAGVLESIVRRVIEQDGYYKISSSYIDYSHLFDADNMLNIDEKIFCDLIYNELPLLKEVVNADKLEIGFSNMLWSLQCSNHLDIEVDIIESEVLYQIMVEEKKAPSDEAAEILNLSRDIFLRFMREDYMTYDLSWEIVDHKKKKVCYYLFTCSEILGDNAIFDEEVVERLNRYNYQRIFQIMELQERIRHYRKL